MKRNGKNLGFVTSIEVDMQRASPSTGGSLTFDLSRMPSRIGKHRFSVLGFIVRAPSVAVTLTAAKVASALTWSQLLTSVTMRMSDKAPPSQYNNGHIVIEAVDGPRLLQSLTRFGGVPTIRGLGAPQFDIEAPAAGGGTSLVDQLPVTGARTSMATPLQYQVPMGHGTSVATAAFVDSPVFFFPLVSFKRNESLRKSGTPAEYWNGDGYGAAGAITITPGSTVDNLAAVYTGTWSLEAVVFVHPKGRIPLGLPPKIRVIQDTGKSIKLNPGIRVLAWIMPPLTSAGGMTTPNYTRVSVYSSDGELLCNPDVSENLTGKQFQPGDEAWKPRQIGSGASPTVMTLTARLATHYSQWGIPILDWDGDLPYAPGDADGASIMQFDVTGETTHYVLDFVLTPNGEGVEVAAKAPFADAVADTLGRNGRSVSSDLLGLLPREIFVPSEAEGTGPAAAAQAATHMAQKMAPGNQKQFIGTKG